MLILIKTKVSLNIFFEVRQITFTHKCIDKVLSNTSDRSVSSVVMSCERKIIQLFHKSENSILGKYAHRFSLLADAKVKKFNRIEKHYPNDSESQILMRVEDRLSKCE